MTIIFQTNTLLLITEDAQEFVNSYVGVSLPGVISMLLKASELSAFLPVMTLLLPALYGVFIAITTTQTTP